MTSLQRLQLQDNELTGTIPPDLGGLTSLQWLILWGNQLSGTIPAELGNLANLQRLDLSGNDLIGEIPAELGNLANLQRLVFYNNDLSGEIPAELGGLTNLLDLSLWDNELIGTIPVALGSLTNLQYLDLWGNQLTGEIPAAVGVAADRGALRRFYVVTGGETDWKAGTNWLTTEEPLSAWHGVTTDGNGRVTHVVLTNNQLTGTITVAVEQLENLEQLILSVNDELTGQLPLELSDLSALGILNISGTDVCVPTDAAFQAWLATITFQGGTVCDPPAAPRNLTTMAGNTRVTLAWTKGDDGGSTITKHQLQQKEGNAAYGDWMDIPDSAAGQKNQASHTVTGLTNGTDYAFQVRAVNDEGESDASVEATATPMAVAALTVSVTITAAEIVVDEGRNAEFTLLRSGSATATLEVKLIVSESGGMLRRPVPKRVTFPAGAARVTLTIRTVNDGGDERDSVVTVTVGPGTGYEPVSANAFASMTVRDNDRTPPRPPAPGPRTSAPGAPRNLTAVGGDGQVVLSWDAPESDGGAEITDYEYRINGSGTWTSTGSIETTYPVTGLDNGTEHTFQVRAVNKIGRGRVSNRAEATPEEPRTVLIAHFANGNNTVFNSRVYLFNPSVKTGRVTVRVFTLPLRWGLAQELTTTPLELGSLGPKSGLNIKLVEDILTPLGITTPYTIDGGNLTLELTILAADVKGAAQVFTSDFAFGTYPLQEIPSTSAESPTVLVANFTNGNNGALNSRVYLWNPSATDGRVTVRVFTLPNTGDSMRLQTVPLGILKAFSARNIRIAEDILAFSGIALPYTDDGGNLMLEFTIEAPDVRGVAQVFSSNMAFGTYVLQEVPSTPNVEPTVLVAHSMNGNSAIFNSRVYLWNPSTSAGEVTVRVFTLPLADGTVQELTGTLPLSLGTLEATSARNIKLAEDILTPLGIPTPYTTDGGKLTLEFRIEAPDVKGVGQVFSSNLAYGTYPLQAVPSVPIPGPTRLVASFTNGNDTAFNSRISLFNPSPSAGDITVRVFTLPLGRGTAQELTATPLVLGTLEARSALDIRLAEDILVPLQITTPYTTDGGNLVLELTIQATDVRGTAQVFSSSLSLGTYPLEVMPSSTIPATDTPESVVDITGDLEVMEDGSLSIQTEMEPLGELTISTHGQGAPVSGSVRVVAFGPIGGVLRFDLPGIGVAGVGASPPVRDAIFPVRRQEGGINTGVAVHNLGEEAMEVTCELMQGGTVLDDASIPLAANGQSSWFINEVFTGADTSDFAGSVRCTAPGEGMFTGVAVELDAANRIFTTLPVVPVPERTSQE